MSSYGGDRLDTPVVVELGYGIVVDELVSAVVILVVVVTLDNDCSGIIVGVMP